MKTTVNGNMVIRGNLMGYWTPTIPVPNPSGTWTFNKEFQATGISTDYSFGFSSTIHESYMAISANQKNTSTGAVYIFKKNEGGENNWGQIKELNGSTTNIDFGYSVSISNDFLAIGSNNNDTGGNNRGAVYVHAKDEGGSDNWGETQVLTADDAADNDQFGTSVGLSGNYIISGAPYDDDNGTSSGSAYIFFYNGSTWSQQAKIIGSTITNDDQFGISCAIDGDYAVVGAKYHDGSETESGVAYVFKRSGVNWNQIKILQPNTEKESAFFGSSVSISGEYIVVGAEFYNTGQSYAGSAFIFKRNEGGADNWGQIAQLIPNDIGGATSGNFGASISIQGENVIVGSSFDNDGGSNTGAVFLYNKYENGTDNWGEIGKINDPDITAGGYNGHSVALYYDTAVSGSPFLTSNTGTAYLIRNI